MTANEWRVTQRSYQAKRNSNVLEVTCSEFDEALEAFSKLTSRELLTALKTTQQTLANWNREPELNSLAAHLGDVIRNAEGI